jgi:2-polyprenyl-3-methyl-5-hydroxy-6-metoxy-1,4-benzoquinol methylase
MYSIINRIIPKSWSIWFKKNRKLILYKIFRIKIDRNQWAATVENEDNWNTYSKLMELNWEEIEASYLNFFKSLKFCMQHCRGEVLEIGAGIGIMTKWIKDQEGVTKVIAIDLFIEAIKKLKEYDFDNVYPLLMDLKDLGFKKDHTFDVVIICEVLEHIYPDEEIKMIRSLKPYVDENTRYIISTPIDWMDDPYHVRGFSKMEFERHLRLYYGAPIEIDYSSDYRQIGIGRFATH